MKAKYYIPLMLLMTILSLAGCSDDFDNVNENANVNSDGNEITFNTNVNNFISKATTYDNVAALKAEGSFACAAYEANTPYTFFEPTKVIWDSSESKWKFAEGQYWKYASALDFFAYMPAEKPTYISSISYPSARSAQFVCNLPSEQPNTVKEFICALATDKTKVNSPSGVSMQFKHHFAKLLFKLDPASGSNVTINSVKISGIKMSGTCTFNGTTSTWSSLGDDTYVMATAIDGTTPYLVIPNNYRATTLTITVNATWTGISNITVDKVATIKDVEKEGKYLKIWEPGYSYLFTLKLSGDILKVDINKFTEQW